MSLRRFLLGLVLGKRLPLHSGELAAPMLERPVTIRRTKYGIPMIEADTDTDAAYAIGFCQGQDRAFQLETLQRVGRGTLAELVGSAGLPVDRLSRRIGFYRAAQAQQAVLAEDVRAVLDAFAHGVNAGRSRGLPKKAHEFSLLGREPTPWIMADTLAYLKLISFTLPSNWDVELARWRMIQADGLEAVSRLDPLGIPAEAAAPAERVALAAWQQDLEAFRRFAPAGGGSNNWVIAGSKTVSGRPLLCNDPHLAPTIPPPWYLMHIRTPAWSAAGAAFVGAPLVIIGHNDTAAWGVTAGLTDNTDLFLETLGADGRSVRTADGHYEPCEVVRETILVKGQADHIEEVVITPRGPIISPLVTDQTAALSLQAVWLQPRPIRGFFDMVRVQSFEEMQQAFREWPCLPLNLLYADVNQQTGWQLVGELPRRKFGNGTIPLPADAPGAGWEAELVPREAMPSVRNPSRGYFATANEHPDLRPDYQPVPGSAFVGWDFVDAYRGDAIRRELGRSEIRWDVAASLRLQLNQQSLPWEELRPLILALEPATAEARQALELLAAWNGQVSADSPAAAVFELFTADLARRMAQAQLPETWALALGGQGAGPMSGNLFGDRRMRHLTALVKTQPPGYFAQPWSAVMLEALDEVIAWLRQTMGPGPVWWSWGDIRPLQVQHAILGKSRWMGPIFNLPATPIGGDANTIFQAGWHLLSPRDPTHNIPNLRAVFDCSNWSASQAVLCGGQSGNPFSPNYQDQYELWLRGEALPLPWTGDDVLRATVATLRLIPTPSPAPVG